jgi:hypothetical protein
MRLIIGGMLMWKMLLRIIWKIKKLGKKQETQEEWEIRQW